MVSFGSSFLELAGSSWIHLLERTDESLESGCSTAGVASIFSTVSAADVADEAEVLHLERLHFAWPLLVVIFSVRTMFFSRCHG